MLVPTLPSPGFARIQELPHPIRHLPRAPSSPTPAAPPNSRITAGWLCAISVREHLRPSFRGRIHRGRVLYLGGNRSKDFANLLDSGFRRNDRPCGVCGDPLHLMCTLTVSESRLQRSPSRSSVRSLPASSTIPMPIRRCLCQSVIPAKAGIQADDLFIGRAES